MLAVNDLLDVEEALEQEEDEGVKLEPFNLAQEREEGHFDEGGSYVENKEEDDPTMRDAWLTSEDGGAHMLQPSPATLHVLATWEPGSALGTKEWCGSNLSHRHALQPAAAAGSCLSARCQ